LKRWITSERLALPSLLVAAIYVIFGGAVLNLIENLAQSRVTGPTPWLVAAILMVLSLVIFLQRRVESRIEDLHRRQRLSVQYFAGGSGAAGQAVYRAAAGLIEKATGPDCKIQAVNSFIEVFANSTDQAAESDRSSYLRTIESKLGQINYHRIIQLNARDRTALARIRIGDVISKDYGEHYAKIVEYVRRARPTTGTGARVVTRLDAVPARYPTSFVLIKTPDGSHLIWQMNEHVPHVPRSGDHPIEDEKVRLAGVFIISDPDEQITQHFERWFNELANSVELTAVTTDQLKKSPMGFKSNEKIVRDLFSAIDGRQLEKLPDFFSSSIIYYRPGFPVIKGMTELDHFYRELRQVEVGTHTIENILVDGDAVSCFGRLKGRMVNGDSADAEFAEHYQFDNGKIVERKTYFFAPRV
jgi:ketosteroid isomerase-like protein